MTQVPSHSQQMSLKLKIVLLVTVFSSSLCFTQVEGKHVVSSQDESVYYSDVDVNKTDVDVSDDDVYVYYDDAAGNMSDTDVYVYYDEVEDVDIMAEEEPDINDDDVESSEERAPLEPCMHEEAETRGERGTANQKIISQRSSHQNGQKERTRKSLPNISPMDNVEREKVKRRKRAVHYQDGRSWGYRIPYVIDESYSSVSGGYYVPIIQRAFRWYNDHTCVTYTDETDNFNQNFTMTELGYDSDIYLSVIRNGSACYAVRGMDVRNGTNFAVISPCFNFDTMLHEIGHTVGVMHVHQSPSRDNYMAINYGNIDPVSTRSFNKQSYEDIYTEYMDLNSFMLYDAQTRFGRNALETYFLMRDDLKFDTGSSSEEIYLKELSTIYKCNEGFCNNSTVDCGIGYYTFRNGSCRCVCPRFYDYTTNCTTMIEQPNSVQWPDAPLVLFKAGSNTPCPDGFQPGGFSHEGIWLDLQKELPDLYDTSDNITYLQTCSRPGPSEVDWEVMPPGGSYCIIKPAGTSCGFGQATTFTFTSESDVEYYGDIGDITIEGNSTTILFCCTSQANPDMALDLPNNIPFRLVARGSCPVVKGMRSYRAVFDFFTRDKSVSGPTTQRPTFFIFPDELQIIHCYYQPPVYGCHREFTLDSSNRVVTLTTPGYYSSGREANKRCFYIFHAPKGAQLVLTFLDYDLDKDDKILVQRSNLWQEPRIVENDNYPYQIVSEANELVVEFWAGYTTVSNKGAKLSVEVRLAEEACYDVTQNGSDYLGDKCVSELYDRCIPWAEAANCDDFPWSIDILPDIGGTSCRNPGGNLLGPWCYTYVNDTVCQRRYCDVCNYRTPTDVLTKAKCLELIAADPEFCHSALQRFGCFKTCGFSQQTYTKVTHGKPAIPSDGTPAETLKPLYREGERVKFKCNHGNPNPASDDTVCRKDGWIDFNFVCEDHGCADKIKFCNDILTKYPDFCLDPDAVEVAGNYCYKSCGKCSVNNQCYTPASHTYSRTSPEATIKTGDVMTFECNPGLHLVDGDLKRACSTSGKLLGQEPLCQATYLTLDVNSNSLRPRLNRLPQNRAFLLDQDGYRVPFNGKITKWYYYCYSTGDVYALVYRKTGSGYTYIGSNVISCQAKRWPWSHNVPWADQISVEKDDVVGFFSTDADTLYVSICFSAKNELLVASRAIASDFDSLLNATFDGSLCIIPSFGYQVSNANNKRRLSPAYGTYGIYRFG